MWIFVRSSYFLKIGIWFKIQKQTKRGQKSQNKTKHCFLAKTKWTSELEYWTCVSR